MAEGLQEKARALLVTSTLGLRSWALARFTELVVRARVYVPMQTQVTAQRFGNQLWRRITTRFPALGDLLDGIELNPNAPVSAAPTSQSYVRPTAGPQQTRDVPALLRALRDPSAEVAAAAAMALSARAPADTDAICHRALIDTLENVEGYYNPLTRVAAMQALVLRLSSPPSLWELEPMLNVVRDVDAEVSMAAIGAIAAHAPPAVALEHLLPIVTDETGYFLPIVQGAATRALTRAGLLSPSLN